MRLRDLLPLIVVVIAFVGPSPAADNIPAAKAVRIVLVSDSTVASYPNPPKDRPDLTGWGQVFGEFFTDRVTVLNHARSGASSKSFIREGRWEKALAAKPDYVLIQFGHNDCPGKGDRSTDPNADFQDYLRKYIDQSRAAGARPILVTPVARRTFAKGKIHTTLQPYADAMFKVGKEKDVPVIDLHAASMALFNRLGDEGSADLSPSAPDRSHFSRKGALAVARLVAKALPAAVPELRPYMKSETTDAEAASTRPGGDRTTADSKKTGVKSDCGTPVDLAVIRKQVRAYVDALQVPDQPYGCYRDKRDAVPSLYATCDVAIIRTVMGEDLRTSLTERQRREWIDHMNSFADPDGTYHGGRRQHSREHANGMVIGALGPLGGKQKYPVRLYGGFDTLEKVGPWLEKIDWRNQWSGSHLFWGGMHCFSCSRRCSPQWREAVFAWLDANLDPRTGWWRRDVPQTRPGVEGLGGGAHIWPIYQHHRHRFPIPERAIDSILAMQKPDGCWMQYTNYLDLDALYGLAYMQSLAPDYRKDDIARAVAKHGKGLTRAFPDFLRRDPEAHLLLAAVGAFGLLNQMIPHEYVDSVRWSDIFSDPRLYQTQAVEVVEEHN